VINFTDQLLFPQEKIFWYPVDRRLVRPQSWCECSGKDKTHYIDISHEHVDAWPVTTYPKSQSVYAYTVSTMEKYHE
jgi:hypothetical protein